MDNNQIITQLNELERLASRGHSLSYQDANFLIALTKDLLRQMDAQEKAYKDLNDKLRNDIKAKDAEMESLKGTVGHLQYRLENSNPRWEPYGRPY